MPRFFSALKLMTENFSDSAGASKNPAEAFATGGEKNSAIKAYEKSLAINPNDTAVIEQSKKLKP